MKVDFQSRGLRSVTMNSTRLATCAALLATASAAFGQPPQTEPAAPQAAPQLTEAEQQFERTLSGATLVGRFTEGEGDAARSEKYTIHKVSKLAANLWLFQTRIEYGEHDLTLPLPLKVLWAGDTPVITVDQVPVPPLGTFSARVLIHEDKYSGTWSGGDHGGHLFGRIERADERK